MGISNSELQQMLIIIYSFCVLLMTFFKVVGSTQSSCGELKCSDDGPPIHFPFRLKDRHPDYCGRPGFVVSCNDRNETVLELPNIPVKFSVEAIYYDTELRVDPESGKLPLHFSDQPCGMVSYGCWVAAVLKRRLKTGQIAKR